PDSLLLVELLEAVDLADVHGHIDGLGEGGDAGVLRVRGPEVAQARRAGQLDGDGVLSPPAPDEQHINLRVGITRHGAMIRPWAGAPATREGRNAHSCRSMAWDCACTCRR